MNTCLISVIIPTFRPRPEDLARSLDSVLAQTDPFFEVIVVDDGSSYPFGGLNRSASYAHTPIHWLSLPKNGGVSRARNQGIKAANGDLIAFLDTGDWWEQNKLAAQRERFSASEPVKRVGDKALGLVYCAAYMHFAEGYKTIRHGNLEGDLSRDLMVRQVVSGSASSIMIKRSVLKELGGFYEEEDIPEDREICLRIALKYAIGSVSSPLVHIVESLSSRSSDVNTKAISYYRFLCMYKEKIRCEGLWRRALSHYYSAMAGRLFIKNHWLLGIRKLTKASVLDPLHILKIAVDRLRRISFRVRI